MYYTENISFNMTRRMRVDLERIGENEDKKISSVIREILLDGIKTRRNVDYEGKEDVS